MEPLLPASHCSRWQLGQEMYWRGHHALEDWESNAKPGYDSWQNLNYFPLYVTLLSCNTSHANNPMLRLYGVLLWKQNLGLLQLLG